MFGSEYEIWMVEEFTKAMSRVLFFREMKQYVNAMDELQNFSKLISGFDLEEIKAFGIEGVKNLFEFNSYLNIEKVFYSAKALKEEAFVLFEQAKIDEGMKSIAFALGLFELIKSKGIKNIPGLDEEIGLIRNRLN